MEAFWIALALSVFAGAATGVGGAIAVAQKRPSERFLASSLGLSAGVMLFVSFAELLPTGVADISQQFGESTGTWVGYAAFFGGIALIAIIDRLVPASMNPHEPQLNHSARRRRALLQTGTLTALAIAIHNFPEGFATFIAALEKPEVGIPIALAIAIHNIPEGIAVAVPLREATGSRKKAFWWALASGLTEPAGAILGFLLLAPILGPATLGIIFAAIAGVMVFISLDELLPTAVQTGKHHTAIYGLIAGMGVMALSLLLLQ